MPLDLQPNIQAQLDEMLTMIFQIHQTDASPKETRTWYTTEEAAKILDRTPFTVRQWCLNGRIAATKRSEKRGGTELWSISSDEITRYKNEGLLPKGSHRNVA
jgi:hypothetical protein